MGSAIAGQQLQHCHSQPAQHHRLDCGLWRLYSYDARHRYHFLVPSTTLIIHYSWQRYKYYLVILDDCSHFLWTFPLRLKSETFNALANFFSYVKTQFGRTIRSIQCDNGREFDNSTTRAFFLTNGVLFRMSCPYTSSQNGKAERMIRSTNNIIRSLLFQASLTPSY